ncbi:MAG: SIMPL domain-containing protein [Bacteroidales bacterium]|nr:SIMPL domain-containing protein [Candidatus Colicola faecequi]
MKQIISAAILSVGIALGGFFIFRGIDNFAKKDRVVTVKGLAEREVMADKVIWPLSFKEVGNDMQLLCNEVEHKQQMVIDFLKQNGISDDEIIVSAPSIYDRKAQQWSDNNVAQRYQTSVTITVSSTHVETVMACMKKQAELLKKGVAIQADDYSSSTQFLYTHLAELKPEMVEQATANARATAVKFAEDADCKLGSLVTASQGSFSITEDATTPHIKNIRVVTNVTYNLK